MKFLLFLLILVILIQFIKYLSSKEGFDNNCFYQYTPDFSLKMSDYFETDANGDLSLNNDGFVMFQSGMNISNVMYSDLSDNLYNDISGILQPAFENKLLNKDGCKFNY